MHAWHPTRRGLLVCAAGAALPAWLASCSSTPPQQAVDFDAWAERIAADWVRLFPSSRPEVFAARAGCAGPRLTPQTQGHGPSRPRCCAQRWHGWIDSMRPLTRTRASGACALVVGGLTAGTRTAAVNQLRAYRPRPADKAVDVAGRRRREPTWRGWTNSARIDEARGRAAAAAGELSPPRFIVERAQAQVAQFLAAPAEENPLVAALARRGARSWKRGARSARRSAGRARSSTSVRPAYVRVQGWLDELQPRSGDGRRHLAPAGRRGGLTRALANYTSTTLTAREIHAIGLREVARLEAEMDKHLRSLGRRDGSIEARMAGSMPTSSRRARATRARRSWRSMWR